MVRNQWWQSGRWFGGGALLLVVVALLWAPWSEPAAAGANTISIQSFAFSPDNLIVPVGATVTWKNLDGVPHQVVSDTGAFPSSMALSTNATYSVTFMQPGSYIYHCGIHSFMAHKSITVIAPDVAPGHRPTAASISGIHVMPVFHSSPSGQSGNIHVQPPRH